MTETVCDCTNPPGNSFATTFYVPPNTIDLSAVFSKFDLKDNAAVFSTVICLLIIYILICVWAFRQDKKDIRRVSSRIINNYFYLLLFIYGRRVRHRMVVGFTTTYAISTYQHLRCEFESRSGEVYSIHYYTIKFVSDLRQVSGFLRVLRFPSPIKLTTVISLKYCRKWR